MKTFITASALVFITGIASADWEDTWASPDLNTAIHDKPVTLVEPKGMRNVQISLYDWYRGNPDSYHGVIEGYDYSNVNERLVATSLDLFNQGNPDHDHANPLWDLPNISSDTQIGSSF